MERVVVVGGGVIGAMHAVAARRRGLDVRHLEREPEPRGASVRNFGLIWVSGRAPGPELSLALRPRAGWEELAAEVPGTGFRPNGSLTLASDQATGSELYHRSPIAPGVILVTGPGGRGMTCAPAIAEETFP